MLAWIWWTASGLREHPLMSKKSCECSGKRRQTRFANGGG